MMQLQRLRDRIDGIDRQIIDLLNERLEQAVMLRKLKPATRDAAREAAVLRHVQGLCKRLVSPELARQLYMLIMAESRGLQDRAFTVAGFQGQRGSDGEAAAGHWDKAAVAVPVPSFADLFDGLEAGVFAYGVVPAEDSRAGIVDQVNELLRQRDVTVVAVLDMDASHGAVKPLAAQLDGLELGKGAVQGQGGSRFFVVARRNAQPD